jgi:outer membrane usher protein FimD/PapC
LKTKFLFPILILLLLLANSHAQDWGVQNYTALIPLVEEDNLYGDLKISLEGEKLIWVDKESLLKVLEKRLNSEIIEKVKSLPEQINPEQLPFSVKFNPENLSLEMVVDLSQKERQKLNLREDYENKFSGKALQPSPIAGAINYQIEQSYASGSVEEDYFNGQFNSFMNLSSVVFENQTLYQSNTENKWFRGDTRLVKDFEKSQIRAQLGDLYPQIQGFMQSRPIGGFNIARNFSLNPYRVPYPTGTQSFTLQSRSMVRYFVNGSLVKTEFLPAGNYTASDIPLNNGLNTIIIEATDDLGVKQVFNFRSAASINLLNEGESRFDLTYGTPFKDDQFKRSYRTQDGELFSGYFQQGFTSTFSGSVYLQNQTNFNLFGSEIIKASRIGNVSLGHARSKVSELDGYASGFGYQYVTQGKYWYQTHTLGLRYENRAAGFRASPIDVMSSSKNVYSGSYTIPIANVLTASVGGNYGDLRDNSLNDRYGFDTTLNLRIFNNNNLSFFVSRNRDEYKVWNDVAYVFLTITFPESNNFLTALYDQQSNKTKLTYIKDNQNRLYSPRAIGSVEQNPEAQVGEMDVAYPTPFGDFAGRIRTDHNIQSNATNLRSSVRLASAYVFAYDDGHFGQGISRPVPNSFIILKPDDAISGQKIGLKSTSPYTEAETGLLNEIIFSNLIAYQYRDIELDPTSMEEGRTLEKDNFTIFPRYRSGHLIVLKETGQTMIKGRILNTDGTPFALEVGTFGEKPFFTNREGDFFVEGVKPGSYELRFEGRSETLNVTVSDKMRGIQNIGSLSLGDSP